MPGRIRGEIGPDFIGYCVRKHGRARAKTSAQSPGDRSRGEPGSELDRGSQKDGVERLGSSGIKVDRDKGGVREVSARWERRAPMLGQEHA